MKPIIATVALVAALAAPASAGAITVAQAKESHNKLQKAVCEDGARGTCLDPDAPPGTSCRKDGDEATCVGHFTTLTDKFMTCTMVTFWMANGSFAGSAVPPCVPLPSIED